MRTRTFKHGTNGELRVDLKPGDDPMFVETAPLKRYILKGKPDAEGYVELVPIHPSQDQVNTFLVAALTEVKEELRAARLEITMIKNRERK